MKRRQFTEKARQKILAYYAAHGYTATMEKFKIAGSVVHRWQKAGRLAELKPEGKSIAYDKAAKPVSVAAIVYLRNALRAFDGGNQKKGELLTRLALVTLEEK